MKNHLRLRWLFVACLAAAISSPAKADDQDAAAGATTNTPPPASAPQRAPTLSAATSSPANRAEWQKHLTLGPGDILNFAMWDNGAQRDIWLNVSIQPDGKVSYLQAHDVVAAGLTIDELRTNIDAALLAAKYSYGPHSIITPVAINSKRFYLLGSVVNRGVYPLERPMTIIEAIGRAGGLETGIFERSTVEMADLSHSFLVRKGQRLPIDFERLFQQGDLTQNVAIEPDDYLYFASTGANEVYVFGSVGLPGTVPYTSTTTVIGAITTRGSFTPRAYRSHVLVIRGSLSHPELFKVDTSEILSGKAMNFRLKPRDIVYVSEKPWQYVQDLVDAGTTAFIQAVVVTYTGDKVGPFIDPIFK